MNIQKTKTQSNEIVTSVAVAGGLFTVTVGLMIGFAGTTLAELLLEAYELHPALGVLVVGIPLTIGNIAGRMGLKDGNTLTSFVGVSVTGLTYGVFGAAVLTLFETSTYFTAILSATIITMIIGLIAGAYVLNTERAFYGWDSLAGNVFIGGFLIVLIAGFLPGILGTAGIMLGFTAFLAGFIIDMVFEIWELTNNYHSAVKNGFGLYVAFTGVFVHVLQVVLQMNSE